MSPALWLEPGKAGRPGHKNFHLPDAGELDDLTLPVRRELPMQVSIRRRRERRLISLETLSPATRVIWRKFFEGETSKRFSDYDLPSGWAQVDLGPGVAGRDVGEMLVRHGHAWQFIPALWSKLTLAHAARPELEQLTLCRR